MEPKIILFSFPFHAKLKRENSLIIHLIRLVGTCVADSDRNGMLIQKRVRGTPNKICYYYELLFHLFYLKKTHVNEY